MASLKGQLGGETVYYVGFEANLEDTDCQIFTDFRPEVLIYGGAVTD